MSDLKHWLHLCAKCRQITMGEKQFTACSRCRGRTVPYYKAVGVDCWHEEDDSARPAVEAADSMLRRAVKITDQAMGDIRNLEPKAALGRMEQVLEILDTLVERAEL